MRRTSPTTSTSRAPQSTSPKARSTTPVSRAAPPNASTCTRRSGIGSSTRSSKSCRATRSGIPTRRRHRLGPLARARQLDVLDAADRRRRAVAARGSLTGGQRLERPGNWFEPTVVIDVDDAHGAHARRVVRARHRHRHRSRATTKRFARMDDTDYGLGASVFTRDESRRGADPRPARRRQRLLEHGRPLDRAPALGRAAAIPAWACRCRRPASAASCARRPGTSRVRALSAQSRSAAPNSPQAWRSSPMRVVDDLDRCRRSASSRGGSRS